MKERRTEEKCLRRSVLIVEKSAKSRSNSMEANQCTAKNAILNEDLRKDIRLTATVFAKKPAFYQ